MGFVDGILSCSPSFQAEGKAYISPYTLVLNIESGQVHRFFKKPRLPDTFAIRIPCSIGTLIVSVQLCIVFQGLFRLTRTRKRPSSVCAFCWIFCLKVRRLDVQWTLLMTYALSHDILVPKFIMTLSLYVVKRDN